MPARRSAIAAPMPENPAPMTATSTSGSVTGGIMSSRRARRRRRYVEGRRAVRALAADRREQAPRVTAPREVHARHERLAEDRRRRRRRAEVDRQAAVADDRRLRMLAQVAGIVAGHRARDV